MPKLSVYNMAGKTTGEEIELNEEVFGVEFNEPVVHQAIVMQQANQRQGTSATKTRGMVRGGGWTAAPQLSQRYDPQSAPSGNPLCVIRQSCGRPAGDHRQYRV